MLIVLSIKVLSVVVQINLNFFPFIQFYLMIDDANFITIELGEGIGTIEEEQRENKNEDAEIQSDSMLACAVSLKRFLRGLVRNLNWSPRTL